MYPKAPAPILHLLDQINKQLLAQIQALQTCQHSLQQRNQHLTQLLKENHNQHVRDILVLNDELHQKLRQTIDKFEETERYNRWLQEQCALFEASLITACTELEQEDNFQHDLQFKHTLTAALQNMFNIQLTPTLSGGTDEEDEDEDNELSEDTKPRLEE